MLKQDGTVWVMGANEYGQLGDRTTINKRFMRQVTHNLMQSFNAKAVAAGFFHSMILSKDGSVWAAGANDFGQLGDGTRTSKSKFVCVTGGGKAVAAGGWHSMVLKNDDSFWATGRNCHGQLGDGSTIDKTTYIRVAHTSDEGVWFTVLGSQYLAGQRYLVLRDLLLYTQRFIVISSPYVAYTPSFIRACGLTTTPQPVNSAQTDNITVGASMVVDIRDAALAGGNMLACSMPYVFQVLML